jgi:hypothetical protein
MKGAGVSEADIDVMIRKNPAKLLGLDSWSLLRDPLSPCFVHAEHGSAMMGEG